MARGNVGAYSPYFKEGTDLIKKGAGSFTDADMTAYMNPYIKGALDPAAREIGEATARGAHALDSRASSMDAFGGSRAALMRGENKEKGYQAIGDLYKTGLSDAFDRATQLWGADKAREMQAGGQLISAGQAVQEAGNRDIDTLMRTGATDRAVSQAGADFDYQQFVENRDWDIRNLGALLMSLQGVQGSAPTTQTTQTESDPMGTALGLAATIFGAIYNPVGTAVGVAGALADGGIGDHGLIA
jgi:hypothetical protein